MRKIEGNDERKKIRMRGKEGKRGGRLRGK